FDAATGSLANATSSTDCNSMDVGHDQSWYNQAIAVDPTNDANVIVGGNLCGLRTTNGTSAAVSWQNVSHWLPSGGGGSVRCPTNRTPLPYVHADWHTARVSNVGGVLRVLVGVDGGLFSSTNLFSAAAGDECNIGWAF